MCGRYTITQPFSYIAKALGEFADAYDAEMERLAGRYNVAPSQDVPAIIRDAAGTPKAAAMLWGFAPPWPGAKMNPINARR